MRVLIVVQRYGLEIAGGGERACRQYAEQLAARGHVVEVATSTARSYVDWANVYVPGVERIRGVTVHRLPVAVERADRTFGPLNARVAAPDWPRSLHLQRAWSRMQGPYLPDLPELVADRAREFDVVVGFTYLYWPTWAALRAAHGRAATVLHPTAHDEHALTLAFFDSMFHGVSGFSFLTVEEERLVRRRFGVRQPGIVAGIGLEPPGDVDPARFRAAHDLGDDPYLLYLGRVDPSKGATELVAYVRAYRARHDVPIRLVVVGDRVHELDDEQGIVSTGFVDEQTKADAIAGCLALAQPSYFESFSIVLTEAWAAGRPALVQRGCEVLAGQALRSGGAIPYDGYSEFEVALEHLLADDALVARLGRAGQAYVRAEYDWDRIIDRYEAFLGELADRFPRRQTTAVTSVGGAEPASIPG
jgi:glycosyltransferase involved in cell wall biosynthesis